MKKRTGVLALFIFIIFLSSLVFAAENATDPIEKAYNCLETRVKNNCGDLTLEEQAFSLLALAHKSDIRGECKDDLMAKSNNDGECWPSGDCKLKETALAVLALDRIGEGTDKAEEWLSSQNKTSSDLDWFLQIDITGREAASCTVGYGDRSYTLQINDDDTLSGSTGSCLGFSQGNYWLQIASSCLDKKFTVSCDKDFITTLIYRRKGGDTVYISEKTNSGSAGGSTDEKVSALCFKQGTSCNYEGSLWAALALSKNNEVKVFLPYLIALSEDNQEFFPHAFLYMLTSQDEYLSNLLEKQQLGKYWIVGNRYTLVYDTALALLALQDTSANEKEDSKQYMIDERQSGSDNCFGSIRDTGFLLYAAWQKPFSSGTTPSVLKEGCEEAGKYCENRIECLDSGGEVLNNFYCDALADVCCSLKVKELTCTEQNGNLCSSGETCDGNAIDSADLSGTCCIGICKPIVTETECEAEGYDCREACSSNEESIYFTCSGNDICCKSKPPKPKKSYLWVWILLGLIILVVLAIIFKNKLRIFFAKIKNKFSKKPKGPPTVTMPGRPMPPGMRRLEMPMRRPMPPGVPIRPGPPGMPSRQVVPATKPVRGPWKKTGKSAEKTDKQLDEAFKKLKQKEKKKK